jgi:hypothetical protein
LRGFVKSSTLSIDLTPVVAHPERLKARIAWIDRRLLLRALRSLIADLLVGIGLLYGYDLHIQTIEGGNVTIELLE